MTTPEPVTGATQDQRSDLLAMWMATDQSDARNVAGYRAVAQARIRILDRMAVEADAAAGIRRVPIARYRGGAS